MKPSGGESILGVLENKIIEDFGSVNSFKEKFKQAGVTQFGSGWCWLIFDTNGKLSLTNTPNAVNPIANGSGIPILGCDIWEHSYYVDYHNARPTYIKAFIENMVNWESVADALTKHI
jgi:Fe-Mn family superoxide dismutase